MRYLLILLVVLLVAWRWKTARAAMQRKAQHQQTAAPAAQAMVCCAQCGLHVPTHDAVTGANGAYCSAAHLRLAEP